MDGRSAASAYCVRLLFGVSATTLIALNHINDANAQSAALRGTVADPILTSQSTGANASVLADPLQNLENPTRAQSGLTAEQISSADEEDDEPSGFQGSNVDLDQFSPARQSGVSNPFGREPDAEEDDATAEEIAAPDALDDLETNSIRAGSALPTEPTQLQPDIEPEADYFSPVGVRLGAFIIRPTLDIGVSTVSRRGAQLSGDPTPVVIDDNEDGSFAEISAGFEAQSDWVRHSLAISANGRFQKLFSGEAPEAPELGLGVEGTLDITRELSLVGTIDYDLTQSVFETSRTSQSLAADAELQYDTGLIALALRGGVQRDLSDDDILISNENSTSPGDPVTGTTADNDATSYRFAVRGGFQASPVFSPFAEAEIGVRTSDTAIDSDGIARDSTSYTLRAGTEIDLGERLSGEVSAGFVYDDFDEDSLSDISAVVVGADLNWTPREGTDVALQVGTTTAPSSATGVSGARIYTLDASINQQIRYNMEGSLGFSYSHENPEGPDFSLDTFGVDAGVTYWFNRYMGLTGSYGFEAVASADETEAQTSHRGFLGLRFQR
ncbi:MAG: outer membrane beta-barrel protein [Pseudomonadota bacterium]